MSVICAFSQELCIYMLNDLMRCGASHGATKMHVPSYFAGSLIALFLSCVCCVGHTSPREPTVTLASGVLVGTITALPTATATVNQFLGVPYAKSPPERFTLPVDPEPWSAPLAAMAVKPACIQQWSCKPASLALARAALTKQIKIRNQAGHSIRICGTTLAALPQRKAKTAST